LEWKTKIPDLEREFNETMTEAIAYFSIPPIITGKSNELEPLKLKYIPKLLDPNTTEAEQIFSFTKLLAPIIDGRHFSL